MIQVSSLHIYPVKSLGGFAVPRAQLTDRGFALDRRWMLTDAEGNFLSQRECPAMALLQTRISSEGLEIHSRLEEVAPLQISTETPSGSPVNATLWGRTCAALPVSAEADDWFSRQLGKTCRLLYMPDETRLRIDEKYNPGDFLTSFSDGFPLLMISEASLEKLNSRCSIPVSLERFRPNLVIRGCAAHDEDRMALFSIGSIRFRGVKPSARCQVTTIDPITGEKGKEPLQTLSAYRRSGNRVLFGENVIAEDTGFIRVGDSVTIQEWKAPPVATAEETGSARRDAGK